MELQRKQQLGAQLREETPWKWAALRLGEDPETPDRIAVPASPREREDVAMRKTREQCETPREILLLGPPYQWKQEDQVQIGRIARACILVHSVRPLFYPGTTRRNSTRVRDTSS